MEGSSVNKITKWRHFVQHRCQRVKTKGNAIYLNATCSTATARKVEERHIFGNSRFCDSCADIVASMDVAAARYAEPPYVWCVHLYRQACAKRSHVRIVVTQ